MIKQTYQITAPISEVWAALTDPVVIEQWSGAEAEMDDNVGSEFVLWDGDIWGTNTKVITNKLLEQDWYGGDWEEPSRVVIELSADGKVTTVNLLHSNVPKTEEKDFADGWRDYYFGPMKELLEIIYK